MKKIISFILILMAYIILGAALVYGTSNFGLGFGIEETRDSIEYGNALDRAGNIYFISDKDGVKSLSAVDSSGKRLFVKKLSASDFGDHFYIGGIYVEHDMGIYVTAYEFDEHTRFITSVSVHLFYEDGTYVDEVFREKTWIYPGGRTAPISSFSEDDDCVYFSVIKDGVAEVFRAMKDNSEPVAKIHEYAVSVPEVYGWLTVPNGDVLIGNAAGVTVYSEGKAYVIEGTEGAIFDRFWNGIGLYYAMDSATGTIYVISSDYSISPVMYGDRVINAQNNRTLADMSEVSVGITGNILGIERDVSDSVYLGSFSLMTEIYTDSTDKGQMVNIVLVLIGVLLAVLILSILTWDFYCSILKMRLSILLRQSLLIALLVFVGLYSLSNFFIIPQVENIVMTNYRHEAQVLANSFERAMNGVLSARDDLTLSAYEDFLLQFGSAAGEAEESDLFEGDDEIPQINLIRWGKDGMHMIASNALYPQDYPANRLFYRYNAEKLLEEADNGEVYATMRDPESERLYLIRRIDFPATADNVYIAVGTRVSGLSQAVENITAMINLFLVVGGVLIVAILMVIENITAGAIRKLKRSVNRIASGNYTSRANIHTGDEVEELSLAVNELSAHIVEKTTSLEQLNYSYYRFVPLEFLKTLGETKFEKISKSLHTKKDMTTMYLRFGFSQNLTNMEPQEFFESINSVFEQITPVIADNGGTAYNFLFNGFNAIFSESAEKALQAAIKIREVLGAFNEIQRVKGRRTVDVRIVIGRDQVLLGFIGDEKRMEPTAVSSAINESEEIEKICVDSGLYIVATESAYRALPAGKYRNRCIGTFVTEASGKQKLYDMFDSDPYSLIKLKEQFMTRFEAGVSLFEKQDFSGARSIFMNIVKYASDDGVSRNYMYLAEHNISSNQKHLTYTVYDK